MQVLVTPGWEDYTLLDSGNGKRLEKFGKYTIVRPDPQALWLPALSDKAWEKADAVFMSHSEEDPTSPRLRGAGGKEQWIERTKIPEKWLMQYKDISFFAKLSPFKHTGVFPEQHLQWDFISSVIARHMPKQSGEIATSSLTPRNDSRINVLNLFAYTGIASLVAAKAGAKVTHIDASYPTIGWARENQVVSRLEDKPIRWILDDAVKYVEREIKRGVQYDGIIMDPPVYGHGPKGEKWDFPKSFPYLISLCKSLLSKEPVFIIINAYAISASSFMLGNVLQDLTKDLGGTIEYGELVLKEQSAGRLLSTGIYGRWSR